MQTQQIAPRTSAYVFFALAFAALIADLFITRTFPGVLSGFVVFGVVFGIRMMRSPATASLAPSSQLSPRTIGLLLLIPGLFAALYGYVTGTFYGGILGFSVFAIPFGLILTFLPSPKPQS